MSCYGGVSSGHFYTFSLFPITNKILINLRGLEIVACLKKMQNCCLDASFKIFYSCLSAFVLG